MSFRLNELVTHLLHRWPIGQAEQDNIALRDDLFRRPCQRYGTFVVGRTRRRVEPDHPIPYLDEPPRDWCPHAAQAEEAQYLIFHRRPSCRRAVCVGEYRRTVWAPGRPRADGRGQDPYPDDAVALRGPVA